MVNTTTWVKWLAVIIGIGLLSLAVYEGIQSYESIKRLNQQMRDSVNEPPVSSLDPPAYPTAELTDLKQGDLPGMDDVFQDVGIMENGVLITIDVTSGSYDHKTGISEFLLINDAPEGYHDAAGRPMAMMAMRDVVDCNKLLYRVANATEVDAKGHIIDWTVFTTEVWTPIHLKTKDNKATVMAGIIAQVCPLQPAETI